MPSTVGIVASGVGPQVTLVGEDSDVVTNIGGIDYRVVTWLSSGSITVSGGSLDVEYLVVAGGGSGGATGISGTGRAGGGAGGLLTNVGQSLLTIDGIKSVVVGAGGAGQSVPSSQNSMGVSGSASSIGTLVQASGGGGGAGTPNTNGLAGGSGGGGSNNTGVGGAGTTGQGNAGGDGASISPASNSGGGGGGAGQAGGNATSEGGGDGGNGIANTVTGTSIVYAGGGGGGSRFGIYGVGGAGGGGEASNTAADDGVDGLGGGGGAASGEGIRSRQSGKGGDGIVILRWPQGFTPLHLPSLLGWWDASDSSTITASGTPQRVSQWDDKTGTYNATQATAGLQPEYSPTESLGGIRVGPSNQRLVTGLAANRAPVTIFLAVRRVGSATNAFGNASFLLSTNTNAFSAWTFLWSDNNGTSYAAQARDSGGADVAFLSPYDTTRHAFTIVGTTTSVSLRQDKGSAASTAHTRNTAQLTNNWSFGAGAPSFQADAWLHEIIICDAELSQSQQDATVDYLVSKWGI